MKVITNQEQKLFQVWNLKKQFKMKCFPSLVYICILSLCVPCFCQDVTTTSTTAEAVRCTEKELEQFSQEYEQCHSRALHQLQAEGTKLDSQADR